MLETKTQTSFITNNEQARWLKLLKIAGLALLVVTLASAAVVGLAWVWLSNPPTKDMLNLFLFLLISGVISAGLALVWLQWPQQGARLRTQLVVTYLVGVVIALINIAVTSGLMFLSPHDLKLTTLLIIFSAAVSVFFAFFISQRLIQPVVALGRAAKHIANGQFDTRVQVGGSYELADLGRGFNTMAQQLEVAAQKQREMEKMRTELVAAISHDLRTPLASLRLMTEAVSDGVTDERTTALFLSRMRNEVEYMTGLIEDLFELSQLDAGVVTLKFERGNLRDLISDTLESLSGQAIQKHQQLEGHVAEDLPELSFDPRKIQRVLNNLISNAIRYTPEGGRIAITACQRPKVVEVSVQDNGEGIAPADLERIFEAFYRSEHSRSRENGGVGLGLAIAKGLVEAHGGQIRVESQEKQGSTFTFCLPVQ